MRCHLLVNNITCGVCGSILGPLLFLLYINDIGHVSSSTTSILFADDSDLFKSENDPNKMQDDLNSELSKTSLWLKLISFLFIIGKTHFMVLTNNKKRLGELNMLIDGNKIQEVKKTTFLGVIINSKLSWKDHVVHVVRKVSRGSGMIIKARNIILIKRVWSPYIIHLYTLTSHIVIIFRVTYIKVIWDNYVSYKIKLYVYCQRGAKGKCYALH